MSVTYQGPIRVNRRNTPNFDGAAILDNTGAVLVTQQTTITFPVGGNIPVAQLPAGSAIQDIRILSSTTGTPAGGAIPVVFTPTGGTATIIGNLTFATGVANATVVYTIKDVVPVFAQAAVWQNVGTVDGTLALSTGLPSGTVFLVSVSYVVRNANGTITNSGQGQTQ